MSNKSAMITRLQLIEAILEGLGYDPAGIAAMSATGVERNRDCADAVAVADLLITRKIVTLVPR